MVGDKPARIEVLYESCGFRLVWTTSSLFRGGGTDSENRPLLAFESRAHSRVWKRRLARRTDLREGEEGVRAVYAKDVRAESVVRAPDLVWRCEHSREREREVRTRS